MMKYIGSADLHSKLRMQYEAREKALKDMVSIHGDGVREGEIIKGQEIAKKMLSKGIDIDLIIELTELSYAEIRKLRGRS
ncbi:transposase [Metabacillus fastidiosus]|uniref:transposase n=1 Tax=Metabacillus fastidiosus TaxID=1458 RepID=UPI002E22073D|nr:transposase [Metabacillus fastidiosus]